MVSVKENVMIKYVDELEDENN